MKEQVWFCPEYSVGGCQDGFIFIMHEKGNKLFVETSAETKECKKFSSGWMTYFRYGCDMELLDIL